MSASVFSIQLYDAGTDSLVCAALWLGKGGTAREGRKRLRTPGPDTVQETRPTSIVPISIWMGGAGTPSKALVAAAFK